MRRHDTLPTDACGGACFITQRSKLSDADDFWIDTGVDAFQLPVTGGRLVMSANGLRELISHAKWEIRTDKDRKLKAANAELRAEVRELREHLRNVLAAAESVDVESPLPADVDISEPAA